MFSAREAAANMAEPTTNFGRPNRRPADAFGVQQQQQVAPPKPPIKQFCANGYAGHSHNNNNFDPTNTNTNQSHKRTPFGGQTPATDHHLQLQQHSQHINTSTVSSSGYNSHNNSSLQYADVKMAPYVAQKQYQLASQQQHRNGALQPPCAGTTPLAHHHQQRRRQTMRVSAPMVPMVPMMIDDDDELDHHRRRQPLESHLIDGAREHLDDETDHDDADNVSQVCRYQFDQGRADCADSDEPTDAESHRHGHQDEHPNGSTYSAQQMAAFHYVAQRQHHHHQQQHQPLAQLRSNRKLANQINQMNGQIGKQQPAAIYYQPDLIGKHQATSFLYHQPYQQHQLGSANTERQHNIEQKSYQHQISNKNQDYLHTSNNHHQHSATNLSARGKENQLVSNKMQPSGRQHLTAPDLHQHHGAHQHSKRKSGHASNSAPNDNQHSTTATNAKLAPKTFTTNTRRSSMTLSCCAKLAKLLLFISNALFWLAGIALGAWGILALVDDHKNNLSQLLVFEPGSRMSLFQLLSWSFITLGCATILVGFCGCSAIFKNNRWILGLYIFLILAIFALDLATGLLAIIFQERLVANVRLRLVNKLRSEYGVQASFTAAIDYIQTKYECCGLDGHFDYDQSLWRLQRLGGFEATVARTCCHLRNTFDDQAHVNPRPVNESMCQSTDVRFHQSYRYRRGCLDDLERLIRQKIWTFTIGCGAVGAVILISLVFATCFCRSIPNNSSRKSSSSDRGQQHALTYVESKKQQGGHSPHGHYK